MLFKNNVLTSFQYLFLIFVTLALWTVSLTNLYAAEEVATTNGDSVAGGAIQDVSPNPYTIEHLLGDEVFDDFVVGPGKIELEIKPGESKTIEMTISNRTGAPRIFEIISEDATGSSDPTRPLVLLGSDRGPYSMKDYVSVPARRFTLGHSERARIPVTITIPADEEAGGRYGSVLVSTVSSEAKAAGEQGTQPQSAVVSRIGSLFFITIPGDIKKDGMLKEFSTIPQKAFYQSGPINFGILFENKGTSHLTPYGELRIKNVFDEEVGYLQLEPWFVMPQSLRLREVAWDRDFLFGKYTTTLELNRGYDELTDTLSYSFWVLPWKPIAGGFAILFSVLFIIRAFFKKFEFKRKD